MDTTLITAAFLIIAFMVLGTAKLVAAPAMRARAEHVGFSTSAYRRIGLLEVLAAVGLLIGAVAPGIGALSALGLLALLGGAIAAHIRNGDGPREIGPAVGLGLVTLAYLILTIGELP
jgi:hypothetical protein